MATNPMLPKPKVQRSSLKCNKNFATNMHDTYYLVLQSSFVV